MAQGITFQGIKENVADIRATLEDLKQINDQLNTARTVTCEVVNGTDVALHYGDNDLDHGSLVPPPLVIAPRTAMPFGAQSSSGGLLVGTEGTVWYNADDGTSFRFHWNNPWAGANRSESEVSGPLAPLYRTWTITGGGDEAKMTFVAAQLMPTPFHEIWAQLGGATGLLGLPTTELVPTPDGIGCFMHFVGGSIYSSVASGTHEIHGLILDKWASLDYEAGILGYPTIDETELPDHTGAWSEFQHGAIYWRRATAAHEMHGPIWDKWQELGREHSELGYPRSDVATTGAKHVSLFDHGSISFDEMTGEILAQSTSEQIRREKPADIGHAHSPVHSTEEEVKESVTEGVGQMGRGPRFGPPHGG